MELEHHDVLIEKWLESNASQLEYDEAAREWRLTQRAFDDFTVTTLTHRVYSGVDLPHAASWTARCRYLPGQCVEFGYPYSFPLTRSNTDALHTAVTDRLTQRHGSRRWIWNVSDFCAVALSEISDLAPLLAVEEATADLLIDRLLQEGGVYALYTSHLLERNPKAANTAKCQVFHRFVRAEKALAEGTYKRRAKWTRERVEQLCGEREYTILEELPQGTIPSATKIAYRCKCGAEPCYLRLDVPGEHCAQCAKAKGAATRKRLYGDAYVSTDTRARLSDMAFERAKRKREQKTLAKLDARAQDRNSRLQSIIASCHEFVAEGNGVTEEETQVLQTLTVLTNTWTNVAGEDVSSSPAAKRQKTTQSAGENEADDIKSEDGNGLEAADTDEADDVKGEDSNGLEAADIDDADDVKSDDDGNWLEAADPVDTKPRCHQYATYEDYRQQYSKWYYSLPFKKAKVTLRDLQREGEKQSDRRKSTAKVYRAGVKAEKEALKERLSAAGFCSYSDEVTGSCKVPYLLCQLHHLRPDEILPDGCRRKKARSFGDIHSRGKWNEELERNTAEDGTLLLQLLCSEHHGLITFRKRGTCSAGKAARREVVARRKFAIGRCQYAKCPKQDHRCRTDADLPLFHFDHIYAQDDPDAPPHMRKVGNVSRMVTRRFHYSIAEIEQEMAKCQLLHGSCHTQRTGEQLAGNKIKLRSGAAHTK